MAGRPAVFLDRDGTIIAHVPYLGHPADVRLLPHAAEGIRRLRAAGLSGPCDCHNRRRARRRWFDRTYDGPRKLDR
jgi:hypothetical protein